jgi:signal transduction histidine kinase
MRYLFLNICLLLLVITGYGQTRKLQQLKDAWRLAAGNDARLLVLSAICDEGESMPPDSLLHYATALQSVARQKAYLPALLAADYSMAYALYRKNLADSARSFLTRKQQQFSGVPEWHNAARLLLAKCAARQQQFAEALSVCYAVLTDSEKEKDTLNQLRAMAGIGSAFTRTGDFAGALQWFLKGTRLATAPRFRDRTVFLYTNAAVIFNRLDQYDSSLAYVQKAIQLARNAENLTDLSNALGMYAAQLMDSNGKEMDPVKYAAAEQPLLEALDVAKRMGDPNDIVTNMGTLGFYYYDISAPRKGIAICGEALQMIDRYQLVLKRPYIYEILARNYASMGDYQRQAEALQNMADSRDTVYQYNSAEAMSELKTKYDVQKKENTIILQQLQLVKKDYLLYAGIAVFLLAVTIAWMGFRQYRRRQKRRAAEAVAEAEETERRRIAADLHDNLGAYAASIASNLNRLDSQGSQAAAGILQEVRNNSNAIVAELSDTIWALKKEALGLTAISDRLKIFLQRIQPSYPHMQLDISEEITTDHSLSASQGFHLFQTLQEAVNNALRHSGGSRVIVHIASNTAGWQVTVSDNGRGWQPGKTAHTGTGGNGLHNMERRAAEGGWKIAWHTGAGGGTEVILRMDTV